MVFKPERVVSNGENSSTQAENEIRFKQGKGEICSIIKVKMNDLISKFQEVPEFVTSNLSSCKTELLQNAPQSMKANPTKPKGLNDEY